MVILLYVARWLNYSVGYTREAQGGSGRIEAPQHLSPAVSRRGSPVWHVWIGGGPVTGVARSWRSQILVSGHVPGGRGGSPGKRQGVSGAATLQPQYDGSLLALHPASQGSNMKIKPPCFESSIAKISLEINGWPKVTRYGASRKITAGNDSREQGDLLQLSGLCQVQSPIGK